MEEKKVQKFEWGCLKMHEKDDDFDVKGGYARD